jgi:hypothetical protein
LGLQPEGKKPTDKEPHPVHRAGWGFFVGKPGGVDMQDPNDPNVQRNELFRREMEKSPRFEIGSIWNGFLWRDTKEKNWYYAETLQQACDHIQTRMRDTTKFLVCRPDAAFIGCDLS